MTVTSCVLPMTFNLIAAVFLASSTTFVRATPVQLARANTVIREGRDDNSDQSTGLAPSIWIPVLVAGLLIVGLAIVSWSNHKIRRLIIPGAATSSVQVQGPRELTAEELTGTINNGTGGANGTTTQPAARTRRTRRPRRTPSQMSVTSLPPYNKEPGEQELVIFRGQDMEDAAIPNEMDEDGDSSMHSRDLSQSSAYTPVPPSPNNTPLLQEDHQGSLRSNSSRSRRGSRNHDLARSSEEGHGLMQEDSLPSENSPEPRGEAPPYFEALDSPPAPSEAQPAAANIPNPTPRPTDPERRSSTIRTFFNRMSVVGAPRGLGHARAESNTSILSSSQSHADPSSSASPTTSRHRPSPSTAASFFRTLSRQRSQSTLHSGNASARLNSPSLISLNSISSPLTHTLTRTEFTYPKTGPTPEQLKIISSRESIARFGVPYGADALAFASTSILDVNQPPPDFDTATGASSSALSLNASSSRLSLHARTDSGGARVTSPLAQQAQQEERDDQLALSSNAAQLQSSLTHSSPLPEGQASTSVPIGAQSSAAPRAATSKPSALTSPSVSEFGKLSAPPSAFNMDPTAFSFRSESRASAYSAQSYATAAESIATRGGAANTKSANASDSETDDDQDEKQEPGTPIISPKPELAMSSETPATNHGREETDATIMGIANSTSNIQSTSVSSK